MRDIEPGNPSSLDAFIEYLSSIKPDTKVEILNKDRVIEMKTAYDAISQIVLKNSPDAAINVEMSIIGDGSASIDVVADEIVVRNIKKFIESIVNCDNFEIYALRNGNVQMNIMFEDILKKIG